MKTRSYGNSTRIYLNDDKMAIVVKLKSGKHFFKTKIGVTYLYTYLVVCD